ncbi:MAG: hypothetical protein AAGI17_07280 [Planctomycetota bacterium]
MQKFLKATFLTCAATAAMIAGCASQQTTADSTSQPAPEPREPQAQVTRTSYSGYSYQPQITAEQNTVGLAFPTGDEASSALLLHTVMPRQINRGSRFETEYHVTNITSGTLQNVVLHLDNIENSAEFQSSPAAAEGPNGLFWPIGNLPAGETRIVRASAIASDLREVTQCASVSYNNILCLVAQVVEPDLILAKRATNRALLCDPVELVYTVRNPGTGTATNVRLSDQLPAGLRLTSGGSTVNQVIGNLGPGEERVVTLYANATRVGEYSSMASANGDGVEAESSAPNTVIVAPELSIESQCQERQFLQRPATFTFTATNSGEGEARNAVVTLRFPQAAQLESASQGGVQQEPGVVRFALGNLQGGESRNVSIRLRSSEARTVNVSAQFESECAEPARTACSTVFEGIPAILLEVVDEVDPVEVGTTTTYLIRVTNQGTAPDRNVRVTATLPDEQRYVSATGATNVTADGQNLTFAPIGVLRPGQVVEWRATVRAVDEGRTLFAVSLVSEEFTRQIQETESTNLYR